MPRTLAVRGTPAEWRTAESGTAESGTAEPGTPAEARSRLGSRVGSRALAGGTSPAGTPGWCRILVLPVTLAGLLSVSACTVGPDYHRPKPWSPPSWQAFGGARDKVLARGASRGAVRSTTSPAPPSPAWWNQFGDTELSALEERVARQNLDVRLATIRLAESRAQARIAAGAEYPSISGTGAYTREQISSKELQRGLQLGVGSAGGTLSPLIGASNFNGLRQTVGSVAVPPVDLWQDGIDATWEIDLWGRVRRSVEASDANLRASEEDRRSTLIAQFAEVARDYMTLRGQQAQLAILRDNERIARELLGLSEQRYRFGLVSELDVENARSQLDSVVAQIPDATQQVTVQVNALSLLLGAPPEALRAELETARPVPPVPPLVPVGVPSELARRRPDIREAEAQLHAATANVGVAVADFYPRVTLSANLNFEGLQFRDLGFWSARAYNFGPSISLPIFQGGQLRGQLQLNQARQQEAAVTYQRTVLSAWRDVDTALKAYASEQEKHDALLRSEQSYRRALGLARAQYTHGLQSFLNVLNAEQGLFNARSQLVSSTTAISSDLVQLYNSLGGGWETVFPQAGRRQPAAVAGTLPAGDGAAARGIMPGTGAGAGGDAGPDAGADNGNG